MGPQTSVWTNPSFLVERVSPTGLNGFRDNLPVIQASQNDTCDVLGTFIPLTNISNDFTELLFTKMTKSLVPQINLLLLL